MLPPLSKALRWASSMGWSVRDTVTQPAVIVPPGRRSKSKSTVLSGILRSVVKVDVLEVSEQPKVVEQRGAVFQERLELE